MTMRKDGSRWARRSIRGGAVRFYGKTYRVTPTQRAGGFDGLRQWQSDPEYDGRLDGRRGLFYTYGGYFPRLVSVIFLHSIDDEWPGPNCDKNGYFMWERWVAENPLQSPKST